MVRLIGGIVAGVVVWGLLVSLFDRGLGLGWPAYRAVEHAMAFSLAMLIARLTESAVASFASGALAGGIGGTRAGLIAGGVLLMLFLPVHYRLLAVFPAWYHLVFLASLPLLGWAGARAVSRRPAGG